MKLRQNWLWNPGILPSPGSALLMGAFSGSTQHRRPNSPRWAARELQGPGDGGSSVQLTPQVMSPRLGGRRRAGGVRCPPPATLAEGCPPIPRCPEAAANGPPRCCPRARRTPRAKAPSRAGECAAAATSRPWATRTVTSPAAAPSPPPRRRRGARAT